MRVPLVLTIAFLTIAGSEARAADLAQGALVYKKCALCHTIDKGGRGTLGPNLFGIFGRKAGSGSFAYSPAMKSSGLVWNRANLDAFLLKPAIKVKGTRMTFAGLSNPADRDNVIAYLASRK